MIQIKNKYTQKIIHEGDFATIKDCVEDAVQKGISLVGANLAFTNLVGANLENANLYRANLENANLKNANLTNANLVYANLENADLENANLTDANLSGAYLTNAKMPDKPVILPPVGKTIIGFKKLANNIVIKVEIPADANRVSTWRNRKCRTSALRVIEVMQNPDNVLTDCMPGLHDPNFVYRLGELHFPREFDSDERADCRPGLHFFMTPEEAMDW